MTSVAEPLHHEIVGSGPALMLMHGGMGFDHTLFRPWLDPLASANSLIYYDHRGNGRSAPPDDWSNVSHATWADDAHELREHLGFEDVVVLGHSYGSFLALEYALRHPETLRALVLVAATPVLDYVDVVVANASERGSPDVAARAVQLLSVPAENDQALLDGFREILPLYFHAYDPAIGEALAARMVPSAAAFNHGNGRCLPATDLRDRLGEIAVPTLVVSGRHDWIMPPERAGARVAAGIPGARHEILEASGHFPFVEEQARFLDLVRGFLAE